MFAVGFVSPPDELTVDKMDIVKRILSTLTQSLRDAEATGSNHIEYERLDASVYYESKVSYFCALLTSGRSISRLVRFRPPQ